MLLLLLCLLSLGLGLTSCRQLINSSLIRSPIHLPVFVVHPFLLRHLLPVSPVLLLARLAGAIGGELRSRETRSAAGKEV